MPRVFDHLVKSAIRLVRQSTTVPNTSNTSAFTAEISDMFSPFFVVVLFLMSSFRDTRSVSYDVLLHIGESRDSTMCYCTSENLEIPRCAIAHLRPGPSDHPGMTDGNPQSR